MVSSIPISLFDRVCERTATLGAAFAALDTARAAHQAQTDHPHGPDTALAEAYTRVVNAAQVASLSMRGLLDASGGQYPALTRRVQMVQAALKAETLAFERYNISRPDDEGTPEALAAWRAARAVVVQVSRPLIVFGRADETDVDDGAQ